MPFQVWLPPLRPHRDQHANRYRADARTTLAGQHRHGLDSRLRDAIRARCFELRYSMVDLDAIAKTKSYFQKANWHATGLNYKAVCKAIDALDEELTVRWRDQ
ncbi:hypothetical protein M1D80_14225 [Phyllobacteriaceae bacterium JZ32]